MNLEQYAGKTRIRFATKADIPAIMDFIDKNWKKGHILATDREIFDFQYVYGEEVCFVLNVSEKDQEILGVLGYIPYGTGEERDIFTAIWMGGKGGFMQGTELILYLEQNGRCRDLFCVGLAGRVVSIMKYLRKQIRDFEHFYRLNPDIEEFHVAKIHTKPKMPENVPSRATIRQVKDFEEVEEMLGRVGKNRRPYKSPEFVKRRYFEHPEFTYDLYHIILGNMDGLLVCRTQEALGKKVYRVIDLIGDLETIAYSGPVFEKKFAQGYEYADCLVDGMEEELMNLAGFQLKTKEDGNIIPNYFEPFEQENIVIHNFMPKGQDVVMFKGDGDQDRPNTRKRRDQ